MAKVITTIAAENGMDFEDIMSFKTNDYVGIVDQANGGFMLMRKQSAYFEPCYIEYRRCGKNLQELDDVVFEECGEHIAEVFDHSNYAIKLECEVY